jgi:hypothetical protein
VIDVWFPLLFVHGRALISLVETTCFLCLKINLLEKLPLMAFSRDDSFSARFANFPRLGLSARFRHVWLLAQIHLF